jgi:hypothetical protein
MATKRGFVQRIEIGRAGLVKVYLIHGDSSVGQYVISDLDADPERFNEQLSKLGILRDAMNRAEPVEIEHASGEGGEEIERAARISRDELGPVQRVEQVTGLVLGVSLHAENGSTADGEKHDLALVSVFTTGLELVRLTLDMQSPERLVANQQLEMIREGYKEGCLVRFLVDVSGAGGDDDTGASAKRERRIIAVAVDYGSDFFGGEGAVDVSGFVETLSLIDLGLGEEAGKFAHVRFTTAPAFTGPGGTVGLSPFTPVTLDLLVPKHSLAYDLFEAGLRDNLRMRVKVVRLGQRKDAEERQWKALYRVMAKKPSIDPNNLGIAFAAELLAPLASASRPVWITISRKSLDHGPDGYPCTEGVPSSDLTPRTLRDLRIPYPAVWKGVGCFNKGVYRFQLALPTDFSISVDGRKLCLHDADEEGIKMAHACLCGEHVVKVEIEKWICDYEFLMDVYQLR